MKKVILTLAAVAMVAVVANAQPRAIGARLGWDPQVSYEHGLGSGNMISLDAGAFYNFHGVQAAATYDWINPFGADFSKVWDKKGEWNWYLGVGAGAGVSFWGWGNTYSYVGVAARVGVEYNFWFPLQLSVDYRPVIGPGFASYNYAGGHSTSVGFHGSGDAAAIWVGGLALSVRYHFNQN